MTSPQKVDYTLHDPGDSPLSQVLGRDTAVRPRMGNSHQQRLGQGKQDARLPQKKPEGLLSQDQGAYLQGTDPTSLHEYVCAVWDPDNDKHITNLKKVQRRAAGFVLNRHRNTSMSETCSSNGNGQPYSTDAGP